MSGKDTMMKKDKKRQSYRFKDVVWRDFSLIAIGFLCIFIFSFIGLTIAAIAFQNINELQLTMIGTLGQFMSYILVILAFYFLHINSFVDRVKSGFDYLKKHWLFIIIVMCASFIISNVYDKLIELLPKYLQYSETQNELELNELFKSGIFIPFAFVLIVIVGPIVEELVFRHLLIGELGKKFNFIVMGVISALSFTYIHVSDAKSPFEFGAYLILAIALVYVYLKSNRNLASSISLHMLNNFISFIWTIIVVFSK